MDFLCRLALVSVITFTFRLGFVYSDVKYVATGGSYTLIPSIKGKIQSLDWRYNGNLVVNWDPKDDPMFTWYRFKEAQLNTSTGELTLTQLKKEHRGVFKGEFQVDGSLKNYETTIEVIDPISAINLICKRNDPNIALQCSVDPPAQGSISWTGPNGFTHDGESVDITSVSPSNEAIYFCTARNEVSTKDKEIKVKDCFQDEPKPGGGIGVGGIVGIVVGFILVLVAIVVGVSKKCRDKVVSMYRAAAEHVCPCWKHSNPAAPVATSGEMDHLNGGNPS